MKNFLKKNYKFIIGIVLGVVVTATLTYAASIQAGNVSFDNTQSGIEADNVNEAINKLYEKASSGGGYSPEECKTPTLNEGDYVTLVPDSKSYKITTALTGRSSEQTINPSELTLWRVIKKNPCNVEVVSEYVSSTAVYFRGTTGYANFVGALNEIARQYGNKYVSSARHMGYDGQTEYISGTSAFDGTTSTAPSTTSTSSPTSGTGQEYSGGVAGDTLYLKDYLLVKNVYGNVIANKVGTTTATSYWLASRRFSYSSATKFHFYGRNVHSSGDLYGSDFRYYASGWNVGNDSKALRPILTLKSGITVSGGSGTSTNPYTLS